MIETDSAAFPRARLLWSAALLGAAVVAGLLGFAIGNAATLEDLGPLGGALAIWAFGLLLLVSGAVVGAFGIDAALARLAARRAGIWRTVRWMLPVLALLGLVGVALAVLVESTFNPLVSAIVGLPWLIFVGTAVLLLVRALLAARRTPSSVSARQPASAP